MELANYEKEHLGRLHKSLSECAVLLKRDGNFPLKSKGKIALYGSGARHTIKGGTGSGEVNSRFFITIEEGLREAGFDITTDAWLDGYDQVLVDAKKAFHQRMKKEAKEHHTQAVIYAMGKPMPEPEYVLPLDGEGDTAIYVLSRISGEGSDRATEPGDIFLTETETRDILKLNLQYPKFLLVLNVGGPVDLTPVLDVKNILLLGQLGTETGAAFAELILGITQPSGKLTTTWAAWQDYSHIGEECEQEDTRYREGIYVGYRYFDSIGKKPLFPFGFGLGYTDFELDCQHVELEKDTIKVDVNVRNVGNHPGMEVVEAYVSCPRGTLDKPYQDLAAFGKTKTLLPGSCETVSLQFSLSELASYDESQACWILEKGNYVLRIGNSSRDTKAAAIFHLENSFVTLQCQNRCGKPDFVDWTPEFVTREEDLSSVPVYEVEELHGEAVLYDKSYPIEDTAKQLTDEQLVLLNVGAFDPKGGLSSIIGSAGFSVPGAAGETAHIEGIDPLVMADGPAGLRLSPSYYRDKKGPHIIGTSIPESIISFMPSFVVKLMNREPHLPEGVEIQHQYCTAIPIGTCIAQSWNVSFAETCGDIVGEEMEHFGVHLWLAPALNIHRTIRCGRNFEYYSEDPVISGKMAAAITRGVEKHSGHGVTLKHYAANNQETNRYNSNSQVSERAMREIYLKGFGIAVREGHPSAVMTSYNLLNGVHTSEHRGIIEGILRAEFGFTGIVMTDWVTGGFFLSKNAKYPVPNAGRVAAAGGDLFMPGSKKEVKEISEALANGTVTREQLEMNASRVLKTSKRFKEKKSMS